MENKKSSARHTIRYREAAQWIQAMVTLVVLIVVYSIQANITPNDTAEPHTPPISHASPSPSRHQNRDASDPVIFEDESTTVTFYPRMTIDALPNGMHQDARPRSYIHTHDGILVIEGDLSSPLIQRAVVFLGET